MTRSALPSLRFALATVALAAIAAVFAACSDCPSACPGTAQPPASVGGSASSNTPEDVARRAVQAEIDGDEAGYLELVRPDHRYAAQMTLSDLRGCDLESAQVLVEEKSISEVSVTVVFSQPCGTTSVDQPLKHCTIDLAKLSDRWYVKVTSGCSIQ